MERRAYLLSAAFAVTVGAAACASELSPTWLSGPGSVPSLFAGDDQIRYSHEAHLKENTACLECHAGIDRADDLSAIHLPSHAQCETCHKPAEMQKCSLCHENSDRAKRSVPRDDGLMFSHARHMERTGGNCARCHVEIPYARTAQDSRIPEMATCMDGCHDKDLAEQKCDHCHSDLSRYSLETIRFLAHGGSFPRTHGPQAAAQQDTCAQCHERSFCSDCHSNAQAVTADTRLFDRTTRSFIHPAPYTALHAFDARAKAENCESCHRPSFCTSCHASQGVAGMVESVGTQHPAGWLNPMAASFHGVEARRAITTCASCHDQGSASVCVKCHQVGGTGGNPHPAGFERRDDPRTNRMCRTCHWR